MWKRETNKRGNYEPGKRREIPAVVKTSTACHVQIPEAMCPANKCIIMTDGARLGIIFDGDGDFVVQRSARNSSCRRISIPSNFRRTPEWRALPNGTHDVECTSDGEILVLDISSISPKSLAAE